jgi:hypothetical protein
LLTPGVSVSLSRVIIVDQFAAPEKHRASERLWIAIVWVELEDLAAEPDTVGEPLESKMRRIRHTQYGDTHRHSRVRWRLFQSSRQACTKRCIMPRDGKWSGDRQALWVAL